MILVGSVKSAIFCEMMFSSSNVNSIIHIIVTFDTFFPIRYHCSWLLLLGMICANVLYFIHTFKMCHRGLFWLHQL